jgi:hypothetical protein
MDQVLTSPRVTAPLSNRLEALGGPLPARAAPTDAPRPTRDAISCATLTRSRGERPFVESQGLTPRQKADLTQLKNEMTKAGVLGSALGGRPELEKQAPSLRERRAPSRGVRGARGIWH